MNYEVSDISVNNKTIKGIKLIGSDLDIRNPTHTIVLLDTSGSMECEGKLTNVKKSLYFLLRFLQKTDRLSLVTFNSSSNIIIENMNVTSEYIDTFRFTIDTLSAGGGTNLSAGLLNVKSIIERTDNNNCKTGLIILTDGHMNEGVTRANDILKIVESIRELEPNISITSIGYNEDHNAPLLKDIATNGGGSYNIVNDCEEVATVFGDILGGLMTTVVQNLQIAYPSSWKCLNMYSLRIDGPTTYMMVGDIYAESETIILFENSDTSTIKMQGVATEDYKTFSSMISWNAENISQARAPYYIAYIRLEIADILENMETLTNTLILERLNPIKEYLNQSLIQSHPLIPILKTQVESIENQMNSSSLNLSQNLQVSAFLGLSRGITNYQAPRRMSFTMEEDLINNINNMSITTPFSNRLQRQITEQMSQYARDEDPTV